eukprot:1923592-Rhodomonas_salina.4
MSRFTPAIRETSINRCGKSTCTTKSVSGSASVCYTAKAFAQKHNTGAENGQPELLGNEGLTGGAADLSLMADRTHRDLAQVRASLSLPAPRTDSVSLCLSKSACDCPVSIAQTLSDSRHSHR